MKSVAPLQVLWRHADFMRVWSVGGGCFFENGVGATGNATFTLINMGMSAAP